MKLKNNGVLAFVIVLLTMPLGHAAMILMEKAFGNEYIFVAALMLGLVGFVALITGAKSKNATYATFLGLFAGLFIWTGWIEFAFVYYAKRYEVAPLMMNSEIVTKPEYLIMPSSVGFWAIFMVFYLFGIRTNCPFFSWIRTKLNISKSNEANNRNAAIITFMELVVLLWTFYLVLLFAYDPNFAGDRHPVTYFIAFASLFSSVLMFKNLIKVKNLAYSLRFAIPTVIVFWNFVEILGRWDFFKEIWTEPMSYWFEITLMGIVFLAITLWSIVSNKTRHHKQVAIN